ncbi:MAG: invasion associated locus B family protein [Pararhodobacter sp.]
MNLRTALALGLAGTALLAFPVTAQETGTPAPDSAAPAQQAGAPVIAATHRDWEVVCSPEVEGQPQQCEMYQLLVDSSEQPIAELSIAALPLGAEFAAGATVTTPLETFLPTGLGFRIGNEENMRIEAFRVCTVVGCLVRMGLSADEINRMKAGASATITIAPFVAVDQPIDITVSLAGFTAAYDDLQDRLAAAAAASR